jgi:hypothetical protein
MTKLSTKQACGSKEWNWAPFPVFPKGKAGVGGFPPRRKPRGSPHKRAAAPLCIPCPVPYLEQRANNKTLKNENAFTQNP